MFFSAIQKVKIFIHSANKALSQLGPLAGITHPN